MKRGTRIECVKNVIMTDGEQSFTKGEIYKTYPYSYQEGWDTPKKVTCAKNDQNQRHIIIDANEEFFNSHFVIVKSS